MPVLEEAIQLLANLQLAVDGCIQGRVTDQVAVDDSIALKRTLCYHPVSKFYGSSSLSFTE